MPEIVYTVKVVLDPSSEKIVGKAIDEGLEQGVKDAAAAIEKATGKQVTFNKVMEEGNEEIKERNNLLKANITNVESADAQARNYDNTLKRLITDEKTDIATLRQKAEQHKRFIPVLEQSVAEMRAYGSATEMSEEESIRYNRTLAKSEQTLRTMMSTNINLNNSLRQSSGEMGDVTGQAGRFNKTMSGANQTIFAFGDLVQDSTQFMIGGQFNFATGMRAIGNNVGFAAELFGNLRQNVERYNQAVADGTIKNGQQVTTLQALGKSFTGVGGAILGVNLAMTGLTLATQLFGRETKEAVTQIEDLLTATTKLRELVSGDSFSFMDETQLRSEIESINSLKPVLDEISAAQAKYTEQLNLELKSLQFLERQSPKYKEELEELEKKYGITTEEVESLNERLKTNQNRLDTISAQKAITPLALLEEQVLFLNNSFRDLFDTTGQFEDLEAGAQVFFELAAASEENSQAQLKYLKAGRKIQEQIKKEKSERQSLVEMQRKAAKEVSELNEQALFGGEDPVSRLANIYSKELQMTREQNAKKAALAKEFLDERQRLDLLYFNKQREAEQREADRSFNQAMTLQDLIGQEEILRADEKTATLLSIDNKYQNLKLQLGAQGLLNKDINDQLEILSEEEKAQALMSINRQEKMSKLDMATQATQALSGLGQSLFGESKELAIAEALISTYFTAQKAYESQFLPVPTPDSPARGGIAAAVAVAQGLARVAAIKSTNIGSGGGGAAAGGGGAIGGGGSAVSPISSTATGIQPTQQINFLPNAASSGGAPPTVDVKIDRAGLAVAVGKGGREIGNKQVRV